MEPALLSLRKWDALESGERESIARTLLERLPKGFEYWGLERNTLGGVEHEIAFFEWTKRKARGYFALLPGGRATIGLDRKRLPGWSAAHRAQWADARKERDLPTLAAWLADRIAPRRTIATRPILVENEAWIPFDLPDPGEDHDDASQFVSHRSVVEDLEGQGFRLPSVEEWEVACAAGTRTLFRWGDDCPVDRYPGGDDDPLLSPANAFGIYYPTHPYLREMTADPTRLVGGDGGEAIRGGLVPLAAWIARATAYVDVEEPGRDHVYRACYRRVLDVPSDAKALARSRSRPR